MQVMKGTKREITLFEWGEVLAKAEKRLADSKNVMSFSAMKIAESGWKKIPQR